MNFKFFIKLFIIVSIFTTLNAEDKLILTKKEKTWIKENPIITVAIDPNQKPIEFMYKDNPRGVGWEYLNYISKQTGLTFKAVVGKDLKSSIESVENSKIDIISSMYIDKNMKNLLFSTPYIYTTFTIVMRKSNMDSFSALYLKNKRFSYIPQYQYHEEIKNEFKELHFIKEDNILESLHAIRDNHADFTILPRIIAKYFINTQQMNTLGFVDAGYKAKEIVFAANKKNQTLINIIDKVIKSIPRSLKFDMRKKWTHDIFYYTDVKSKELTVEDKKYLRVHSIIRYSGDPSWLPYEAFDKNGRYKGIVAEYIRELEKKLNITFLKVPSSSWEESVQMLKNGKIDMLSETTDSDLKDEFIMTNSYLSNPIGIVMTKEHDYISGLDEIEDKRVALVKGYGYVHTIEKNFPQIDFIYVKDTESGLKKVSDGEIDAFVCTYAMADYQINNLHLENIKTIGSTQFQTNLAFAVSPEFSTLVPILNKAIAKVTVEDREKIIKKWIKTNAIIRVDYTMAWIVLAFSLLIIIIILYSNAKFRKENKTKQKAQKDIEVLNNRFKAMSDNINGMLYESVMFVDGTSKGLFVSSGCEDIFNVKVEKAMADFDVLFRAAYEKDLYKLKRLISKSVSTKEVQNWKGRILVNGKTKWLHNSFIAREDENKTVYFDGLVVEITKEKEAELKLQDSEEFIQSILNAQEQIVVISDGTKIDSVNNEFLKVFNFKTLEDFQNKYECICNIFDLDAPNGFIQMHIDNELWIDYILTRPNKVHKTQFSINGEKLIYSVSVSKLREGSEFFVVVFSNITELENTQKILAKEKIKAEDSDKAKSEFLANMSHEIRTPMNAVIGFTELLENTQLEDKQKQYLSSIKAGSKSLLRLINDILDLSKIEAGKITLEYEVISLFSLSREVKQVFEQKIKNKKIIFELVIDKDMPNGLLLDETRIRQVLFNLLGNATKFTDTGKISVILEHTKTSDTSKIDLCIKVQDTGIGIALTQQDKIFEKFEQHDGQSTRKYGGTGLGLSISKRLVEMMNGKLSVESEEGKGSTFSMYLYNVEVGDIDLEVDDNYKIDFKSAKILVVDDIKDNLNLIKENLDLLGLQSVEASNGEIAIEILRKEKIDLILMDLNMPVLDGYGALDIILKNDKINTIPIIAISASVMQDEKAKAISKGFDLFLEKPITQDRLQIALAKFLVHKNIRLENKSIESIEKLDFDEDIKIELKKLYLKECEEVVRSGMFDNMSDLSTKIKVYASDKNIASLTTWSTNVSEAIEAFDIEKINTNFKELIGTLS